MIKKIIVLLLISLFIITGCKKDDEIGSDIEINDLGNVYVEELGKLESDGIVSYNFRINNTEVEEVNIDFIIEFKKDNKVINTKTISKNIKENDSEYISIFFKNDEIKFDSYEYDIKARNNVIKNYDILENIDISYLNNGNSTTIIVDNKNKKIIDLDLIVLFFKSNKLVESSQINVTKIKENNIKNVTIKNSSKDFDQIIISVNNVKK